MATDITKYKSIKEVPADEIHARSKDGKTLVLKDGTKVSDKLIAEANARPKAKEAKVAGSAGATSVEALVDQIVNHPNFEPAVTALAEAAARRVLADSQEAK